MSIRIISPRSWHSLLYVIRGRPAMYLGSKSLKALHLYVEGFFMAEATYGIPREDRFDDFKWCEFEPWLQKKLKKSMRSFMLAKGTDEEAFDQWFSWYDEYNQTEGKEDYANWKLNNEQQELQTRTKDEGPPWLY